MKTFSNHSKKPGDHGGKSKSPHESSAHAQDRNWGQPAYKRQVLLILSLSLLWAYQSMDQFTLLRLSINKVFNAIKDHSWVRHPRPVQYDPLHPRVREYCSYHDDKGHKTIHCRSLRRYLEELIHKGFLKEYVHTSKAVFESGQSITLPLI